MNSTAVITNEVFQSSINILNDVTLVDSLITTSSDRVIGQPDIGHDLFHSIANNLIRKALTIIPGVAHDIAIKYNIDINNPSGFNFNGERSAMIAQAYLKSFKTKIINDQKYLVCNIKDLPSRSNNSRLARLLAMDLRTSISLSGKKLDVLFHEQLYKEFSTTSVLRPIIDSLLDNSDGNLELINSVYRAFCKYHNGYNNPLFDNLPRFLRDSIDANTLLSIAKIKTYSRDVNQVINDAIFDATSFYLTDDCVKEEFTQYETLFGTYSKSDLKNYSLSSDMQKYLNSNQKSQNLAYLEYQFHKMSLMTMEDYLTGSSNISFLIEEVYMSDFDTSQMKFDDDQFMILTSSIPSLLENDMIKFQSYLASTKAKDGYLAKNGDHNLTILLREQYQYELAPIKDQLDFCLQLMEIEDIGEEEYLTLTNRIDELKKELKELQLSPKLVAISDQLTNYYGYCDL